MRRRGLYDGVEYHALREELWWRKFTRMEKGRPIEAVGAISDSLDEALAGLSPTEQLRFRLNGKWYRENRVPDFYEMCPREEPCLTPRERSERRLQSRIDVLKALDPGRRAIRAQYDEGDRRIMGEHDIPDETWYRHLTLNSLRWRKSSRGQISEGTLHAMTETSLLSELQASLPISNFALNVHIDNRRESKGAIFTVSRDGTPVVTCMLAALSDDLAY